jgi:putative flavoprotein involved in K+ transport
VGASGAGVVTEDGAVTSARTVIWATGHRAEYPWLRADVVRPDGHAVHRRGATGVPGLYFIGLSWLHTRGSALLGWVGRDARHLADQIGRAGRAPTRLAGQSPTPERRDVALPSRALPREVSRT